MLHKPNKRWQRAGVKQVYIQLAYLQWRWAWSCSDPVRKMMSLCCPEELLSFVIAKTFRLSKQTCFMEKQGGFVAIVSIRVRWPKACEANSLLFGALAEILNSRKETWSCVSLTYRDCSNSWLSGWAEILFTYFFPWAFSNLIFILYKFFFFFVKQNSFSGR